MKKNSFKQCFGLFAVFALVFIFTSCETPDAKTQEDLTGTVEFQMLTGSPVTGAVSTGANVRAVVKDSNATVFQYQWQKSADADGPFTNIAGKTSQIYNIAESDAGGFIRVTVTAPGYNGAITADTVLEVEAPGEPITGTVTFEKDTAEGDPRLFIDDTVKATVSGSNATEFEYQWQKKSGETGGFVNFTGKRPSDTYTLNASDVSPGDYIRVVVTAEGYSGNIPSDPDLIRAITFTVTFKPDGGTLDEDTPEDMEVEKGDILFLTNYFAKKDGKAFAGWYVEDDQSKETLESIEITGDITLVAMWAEPVTVTLTLDGGKVNDNYGDEITETTFIIPIGHIWYFSYSPVKNGYIFTGWYDDDTGEKVDLVEGITVDADITIVAKWAVAIRVTLDPNGGVFDASQNASDEVAEGGIFYPSWLGLPPTKNGFILAGWLWEDGTAAAVPITVDGPGPVTLKADWLAEGALGVYRNIDIGVYVLTSDWGRITGAFFSDDDIHISSFSSTTVDGKPAIFDDPDEIKVGGELFRRVTTENKTRAGNDSVEGNWTKGTVTLNLFWFGGASLREGTGEDANTFSMDYRVDESTLFLLRSIDFSTKPGEIIWSIPIVDGKLQGWTKEGN